MFGDTKKLEAKVSSTLYDLTHLEINTIIKDEMSASKAPASPRLLLHSLATTFHLKLLSLGDKYNAFLQPGSSSAVNPFRGESVYAGSGYNSFKELSDRAESSITKLNENKAMIRIPDDTLNSDIMMLQRIHNICDDIRRILKMEGVDLFRENTAFNFDNADNVKEFRNMPASKADAYELNLDLRQLMVIKKANDIGTEQVLIQTVIGMDGDVTTRISKSFAEQPITIIHQVHQQSISISVEYWKSLIQVVVKLGESILGIFNPKGTKS